MRMHFNISQIIYTLGLFAVCFAVSLYDSQNPLTKIYARGDTSVYQYIGQMMRQGILPYRDIFDHKGPLVYLWNMMGGIIHPMWGQWFLEFLLLLGSSAFAFIIAHKYLSSFLSFLITATVILLTPDKDTIGNTENLSVFLNFAFLYYCLQIQTHTRQSSFILGIITVLQLFIKPTHAMMDIIFGLGLLLKLWKEKNYSQLKTFVPYSIIGFASATGLFFLGLWICGILPDFYQDYIIFNLQYIPHWKQTYNLNYIITFYLTETLVKLLLVLMGILILFCFKPNFPYKPMIGLNAIATFALLFLIIMPHNPLTHYIYMLAPLLFISLTLFCLCFPRHRLLTSLFLTIFFICGAHQTVKLVQNNTLKQQDIVITDTTHFLEEHLQPNEPFIVLGYDMCRLHFLSKRPPATHYPMNSMINQIMPEKLFAELKQTKPKLILLRIEEIPHYADNFKTYWPQFPHEYQLMAKNSKYYIFSRLNP